jgi:hypothetical protein
MVRLTRDRLLLDCLFQGSQSVLAHHHHLAPFPQRDHQGADIDVFAREFEDLRF